MSRGIFTLDRRTISLFLGAFLALGFPLHSAPRALIVTGLSGSSENAEEFQRLAMETKRLLVERGVPAVRVDVLDEKVTRDAVLQKLRAAKADSAEDEFWLVLYGVGGRSHGDEPAFQVSGPRLTASDLKTALDAIPARQYVFVGTSESGAFLPALQNSRRAVLSATKEDGEADVPRFPAKWVSAFSENPKASFARIAARASALVEEEYKTSSLAQSEHARLADPVSGQILEPPFGVNMSAADETPSGSSPAGSLPTASDITVKIQKPNQEWEQQPATAETKKIIAAARATPNPDGHAALVLEQRLGFTVEEDRTTDQRTFWRVFVARDEAVAAWANQFFPQLPPAVTTKLEVARVIQPDGSATVFNPAKLLAAITPEEGSSGQAMVFLPNARAGCVIEMGFNTREILNPTLPHVSEEIQVQRNVPALKTELEIRVPEKPAFHVSLNNVTTAPAESLEHGRRDLRWQLGALPAMESLPGDPPWRQWAAYVSISSLPSWDEFAAWYRRLAEGSDATDETVARMAAQLADGAGSRLEKIRRDYEFVSALRYIAIEIGVQGFRPRTPAQVLANRYGDCKDKANLLVALLRSQGIAANFVLLNRGSFTDVRFPSWQFNHAIAYVPNAPEAGQPDGLWLDSTDGVTPFGFLPPGDFGLAALVFGKDKAEFKTVAERTGAVTEIRDEWELQQEAEDSWKGIFHRRTTGLADDTLRRLFRELTPMQRREEIYRMLAELWQAGDFANGTVSGVSASREGVEVRADVSVSAPGGGWPRIDASGLEIFSAPERDRPLRLNDGQPFALTQNLRLRYSAAAPETLPEPWRSEAAGEKMSVTWERIDGRTVLRTARLEMPNPTVRAADYVPLRRAIRGWNAALANWKINL